MADFDTPVNRQHALAVGRGITRLHIADIGHDVGFGQIAAPVDPGNMVIPLVRAGDEVAHVGDGAVGDDLDRFSVTRFYTDGAKVARFDAEVLDDLRYGGEAEAVLETFDLARLDFIERVVAAYQQQPHLHAGHCAFVVPLFGGEHK